MFLCKSSIENVDKKNNCSLIKYTFSLMWNRFLTFVNSAIIRSLIKYYYVCIKYMIYVYDNILLIFCSNKKNKLKCKDKFVRIAIKYNDFIGRITKSIDEWKKKNCFMIELREKT